MHTCRLLTALMAVVVLCAAAQAETSLSVKGMHLCCGACVRAVNQAIEKVEGASVEVQQKEGSITITTADNATAQKALNAIAAAGFHGSTDNDKLTIKDDSGAKAGKVSRLELTGVHNCCGGCNRAIKEVLASVDGVAGDTAEPKADSFVVEGDFDALQLVQAFYKAGFHVKLKQ